MVGMTHKEFRVENRFMCIKNSEQILEYTHFSVSFLEFFVHYKFLCALIYCR
jgi:hypothetical protein